MQGVEATAQLGKIRVEVTNEGQAQIGLTGVGTELFAGAQVFATSGRGFNPSEIAELCINKIFFVSKGAPPDVLEQATAYRANLLAVLTYYMGIAQRSQNTTIFNILKNAGHDEAAELVRKL
ncbi:MAG: hypothetical protein WC829_04540 [Hyphomicrobium sp.]